MPVRRNVVASERPDKERTTLGDMMGAGMMGGMGLWMLLWALVGIAVVALAVLGIVWLVRRTDSSRPVPRTQSESAEDVLRRRYAAGEIDEDEYVRRRAGLS